MRDWTNEEVAALQGIAARLGTTPRALVGVMSNESSLNPAAHNPGGAVGLIQFEPDTLRDLGWTEGTDAFAKLGVLQQLPFVERYYSAPARKRWMGGGIGAAYVGAFLPALMPHALDVTYVLCGITGPFAWAYSANKSFDTDHKGWITVHDLIAAAERAIVASPVARSILARTDTIPDTLPPSPEPEAGLDIPLSGAPDVPEEG
jgi:hypothetical protein